MRRSGPGGRPGEHVEEEVAAALTLTGRAAGLRVAVADGLARLPGVGRALAAGRIDADKAEVFTGQLMLLEYLAANAIAGVVLPRAPGMTTGQLRAALVGQIMDYDPAAVIRRRKDAEKDARVETWTEPAGTSAIAGRDLPPADVLAADKTLTADARWLKAHGADGTMDQLRAKAFTARLTGQPLDSLLPTPGPGSPRRRRNRCGRQHARRPGSRLPHAQCAAAGVAGRNDRQREPDHARSVLARPVRCPRADQRSGRRRRRNLPRLRRRPGPPARCPVVHHPHRPRRSGRGPRVCPRRAWAARQR